MVAAMGRRGSAVAVIGLLLAALICSQAVAAGGSTLVVIGGSGKDEKARFVAGRAKLRSGALTVGQTQTVVVKGLPAHFKLGAYVEPTVLPICDQPNLSCYPQPLFPAAGTPRFRTSGKGRAVLTFVMPPAFELFNEIDPTQSHPIQFAEGQTAGVDISGFGRTRVRGRSLPTFALAIARAPVHLP
jgi:hypothetical protein